MSKTKTAPEPPRAQDLTSAEKQAILQSVPCGKCGAGKGKRCVQPSGAFAVLPHAARYAAVGRDGKNLIAW